MIQSIEQIFETESSINIINTINIAFDNSSEAPFWVDKSKKLAEAIFSILIPLRENNLLFSPEGDPEKRLTKELFYSWCDLYSLKILAFTIQESNKAVELKRTKYDSNLCSNFRVIDLDILGRYLASYNINLEKEELDFPIAHYNLHVGITATLKSVIK